MVIKDTVDVILDPIKEHALVKKYEDAEEWEKVSECTAQTVFRKVDVYEGVKQEGVKG